MSNQPTDPFLEGIMKTMEDFPDPMMVEKSIEAFRNGDFMTSEELLEDTKNKMEKTYTLQQILFVLENSRFWNWYGEDRGRFTEWINGFKHVGNGEETELTREDMLTDLEKIFEEIVQ